LKNQLYLFACCCCLCFLACNSTSDDTKNTATPSSGDEEIDEVTALIDEKPGDADLYRLRGEVYADREIFSEAIRDFTTALELDSDTAIHYMRLADAYLNNNMSFDALQVMKDAREAFPKNEEVGLRLAKYHLIVEQYMAAINLTNNIIKEHPGSAKAYLFKGMVYREMEDRVSAMEALQSAVELDAELVDAWLLMGEIMGEEDLNLALTFYDNAIRAAPNQLLPTHSKALFLHQSGRLDQAIEVYKKAHQMDPSASETFYNAGLLYLELDSLDGAESMFTIAIGNDPSFSKPYFYRAEVHFSREEWEEAMADYKRTQQLNPQSRGVEQRIEEIEEKLSVQDQG